MIKIGQSFDIHRMEKGKYSFKLGLVSIPGYRVIAHSDGDVLIHAIVESFLGALALGSLGEIFPENEANKNRNSQDYLIYIKKALLVNGYKINNIDTMIFLEQPRLKKYLDEMRKKICSVLEIKEEQISIKPTTMEKLGAIGQSKAIAASSVVLISEK